MTTPGKELELLPCPFCGEKPVTFKNEYGTEFVDCSSEDCYLHDVAMDPEAWNTRPAVTQGREKALEEALRECTTVLDGIMGDSDGDWDESPEFKAHRKAILALTTPAQPSQPSAREKELENALGRLLGCAYNYRHNGALGGDIQNFDDSIAMAQKLLAHPRTEALKEEP